MRNTILQGDALAILRTLPEASVQSCVTSPPYWGLRDYGVEGQLGLEDTPEAYVTRLVEVFREVRRVLCDNGTLWLNLGDSYASSIKGSGGSGLKSGLMKDGRPEESRIKTASLSLSHQRFEPRKVETGLTAKNLIGIPWRVAFALQADGWILRSDVIWHKPNAMPESVKDRPTKAHEYLFLLAKSERYYYDADAVREPGKNPQDDIRRIKADLDKKYSLKSSKSDEVKKFTSADEDAIINRVLLGRNRRTVWDIATVPYKGAHFAVMPQKLVEPCILASSREGDIILDPFSGAGTVALVASQHKRDYIGIELNPDYITLAEQRLSNDKAA